MLVEIEYPMDDRDERWATWYVNPAKQNDEVWTAWFDRFGLATSVRIDAAHGVLETDRGHLQESQGSHAPDDFSGCVHPFAATPTLQDILAAANKRSEETLTILDRIGATRTEAVRKAVHRFGPKALRKAADVGELTPLRFLQHRTRRGLYQFGTVIDWDFLNLRPSDYQRRLQAEKTWRDTLPPFSMSMAWVVPRSWEGPGAIGDVIAPLEVPIAEGGWFLFREYIDPRHYQGRMGAEDVRGVGRGARIQK